MKVIVAAASLALLVACQAPGTNQSQEDDQCGASSHQYLVGTLVSDLNKLTLPELSRILHPTTPMMTRDYRIDRVNIYVDEGGKVVKVACG